MNEPMTMTGPHTESILKARPDVASTDMLERIVRSAFRSGQNWAETYESWFTPTESATEKEIKDAVRRVKRIIKRSNAGAVPRRGSDVGTSPLLGDSLKAEFQDICNDIARDNGMSPLRIVGVDQSHSPNASLTLSRDAIGNHKNDETE